MRELVAVCLLLLSTNAYAYRGRPLSDLRFDDRAPGVVHLGGTHPAVSHLPAFAASDGTDFLLLSAWSSNAYSQKIESGRQIGPRRLIAHGEPVNLVWTGSHYLAGWTGEKLRMGTLSREGTLLSTVEEGVVSGSPVHFAANRTSALAVGLNRPQSFAVRPLDLHGTPTADAVHHAMPAGAFEASIAPAANGFAIVFTGESGTWLMLLRADGSAITNTAILLDGPYGPNGRSVGAAIATDGTDTVVVFTKRPHVPEDADVELWSVVVSADTTIKAKHLLFARPGITNTAGLSWDGTRYTAAVNVVWDRARAISSPVLLHLGRNGQRTSEITKVTLKGANRVAYGLATNGHELLLPVGHEAVTVQPSTLRTSAPFPIQRTLSTQHSVQLAAGGDGYLTAWHETSDGGKHIRASRIDRAGNYRDGDGITIQTYRPPFSSPWEYSGTNIAIDGNGSQWLVVWTAEKKVYGRFLSFAGALGKKTLTIGDGEDVSVRWDGSKYVVLSSDGSLRTNTVSAAGVVGTQQTLAVYEQFPWHGDVAEIAYRYPRLALVGGRILAFHTKEVDKCPAITPPGSCYPDVDVHGRRLDGDDTTPFVVAQQFLDGRDVAVAETPSQALVSWSSEDGVVGAFVSADAQVGTHFFIADGGQSALAYDGSNIVAAWLEYANFEIGTARITPGGVVENVKMMQRERYDLLSPATLAASATHAPLLAFRQSHPAYDNVDRAAMSFVEEIPSAPSVPAPPPAPAILCATKNAADTITVRWQPMQDILGFSIELELPDGAFRQIAVAPSNATSTRVMLPGLEGDVVRLRAWNAGGLSEPSPIAPSLPMATASMRSTIRACAGTTATIDISLTGTAPFTIRWSDGFVQSNVDTMTATRTVTVTRDATYTIVSVSDGSCAINESPESVRITADPQMRIQNQTRDVRIAAGQTATLSVTATDATTYAWFEGQPGDTSRPVGRNASTFTTPALPQSARYWVRVSNRCGSVDSQTMTVTVSGRRRAARR